MYQYRDYKYNQDMLNKWCKEGWRLHSVYVGYTTDAGDSVMYMIIEKKKEE